MGRFTEVILGEPVRTQESFELNQERAQNAHLQESLDRLERQIHDDEGWRRMGAQFETEFTRAGVKDIVTLARAMYMYHPLIRRAVDVTVCYTWGQGFEVKAGDEKVQKEVIDPMMEREGNKSELYNHQSQILSDTDQMNDGSTFFRMPTDQVGDVDIRSIPCEEIENIYTKPGDRQQVWFYERMWEEEVFDLEKGSTLIVPKKALYPDWTHHPAYRPDNAGGTPILWDEPIIHQKSGGLKHMQFGIPDAFPAFEWARAYKKFLEDWHTLVASLSRFAWKATTEKKSRVKKIKDKLNSRWSEGQEGFDPEAPIPGSAAVMDSDTDLTPINKSGATTSAEDAKMSRLMVASAMNIPDTMLSNDPQQGALATAKTLDRPYELFIGNRQKMWGGTHNNIFQYGILAKQRRSFFPQGIDQDIEISFPSILEHDLQDKIKAIVSATTLDGKEAAGTLPYKIVAEMLMQELGVENISEAMKDLDKEQQENLQKAVDSLEEALNQRGKK